MSVFILHVHKYGKKKVTRKFKSGGLHEKHVVATWKVGEPSEHSLVDTGKLRKTCVEVAGHRTFRILTSSQQKCKNIVINVSRSSCKVPLLLSDFNKTWIFPTDPPPKKKRKYQVSWKSVRWERSCFLRTDPRTDMTKLIVAFRNFVNVPNKMRHFRHWPFIPFSTYSYLEFPRLLFKMCPNYISVTSYYYWCQRRKRIAVWCLVAWCRFIIPSSPSEEPDACILLSQRIQTSGGKSVSIQHCNYPPINTTNIVKKTLISC